MGALWVVEGVQAAARLCRTPEAPRTFLTSVAVSHADCKWLAQLSLIMQTISMDR